MDTVTLGRTGLEVTPIAYGTWQFGGDWGAVDEGAAIAAIRHAHSLGINFFDTAQSYGFGTSEQILGKALAPALGAEREQIVLATKGGLRIDSERGLVRDSSPDWLRQGVEQSLNNLGVDRIDLYQVHWPDSAVPLAETGGALAELIAEGKIGHVGVSNFTVAQIEELGRSVPVEAMQPPYHLFRRQIEAEELPHAGAEQIGVLVYGPLAHGLLGGRMDKQTTFPEGDWRGRSDDFSGETFTRNLHVVRMLTDLAGERGATVSQLAIAWTLAHPAVQVAIVGARGHDHIEDSSGAADLELSKEELDRIDKIMASAVPVAGASPETI